MRIELPYGKSKIKFTVEERRLSGIITPNEIRISTSPTRELQKALGNPIDTSGLESFCTRGKTVAIAVDDVTRETPTHLLLPPILRRLKKAGINRDDVTIVVALGTHRRMTEAEMKIKYGERVVENYRIINHEHGNEFELTSFGAVAGIPVKINREFVKANVRLATGNIIPHCNAGWSGGAKILLPGLAGTETVGNLHILTALRTPNVLGTVETPMRQMIEACAEKVGIHFIVNTVLSRNGKILKAFSGNFKTAHRAGVEFAKKIYAAKAARLADITVSSSFPADVDFWQGSKGLFSADLATKTNGGIVLLTPCPEGFTKTHSKWAEYLGYSGNELKNMSANPQEVEDPTALGIALIVATIRERHPTCVVSSGISQNELEKIGMHSASDIEEALNYFYDRYPAAKVNVLTHGGDTYPLIS
jgi:nickel-dependent lactate racemase